MNEVEFRNWLASKGMKKKVQSDTVSRLKRVEKEINRCDIMNIIATIDVNIYFLYLLIWEKTKKWKDFQMLTSLLVNII